MVTLATLANFAPTIFEPIELPPSLDNNCLIDTIIWKYGELEVLYSSPEHLKHFISIWSKASQYTWEKLAATLSAEYNPIENYDRQEESTTTSSANTTGNSSNTGNDSSNLSDKNQVYGYNELTTPADNSASTSASTSESTSASTYTSVNSADAKNVSRVHGNIGVTTTQKMLTEEREVAMFDIYDVIADDFRRRFLVWVY